MTKVDLNDRETQHKCPCLHTRYYTTKALKMQYLKNNCRFLLQSLSFFRIRLQTVQSGGLFNDGFQKMSAWQKLPVDLGESGVV